MATVFKALDCHTHQPVVIKVPHMGVSARSASRLAREAATLGKLDHPGILKIIPMTERSRPYLVMEYLEGRTLYDILESDGTLSECDALRLGSRLCDILDYIHRYNVIHCDLKPGNIMISDDGSPHIIDFGIATEPTWFSPKFGTPEYMAPEQIRGDRVDARTDIYGLGVVLYEAVTDTRPANRPRSPREFNRALSEQIDEIILHAIAPNPADRYPSAAEMKAELDAPQTVEVTGRYKNPRKASAWPKRLRLAVIILSLTAAPFALFFFFLWMLQRQGGR